MSPLLRLPAELRNRIYELSLENTTTRISCFTGMAITTPDCCHTVALRQSCEQIRFETRAIFFSHCTFDLTELSLQSGPMFEGEVLKMLHKDAGDVRIIKTNRRNARSLSMHYGDPLSRPPNQTWIYAFNSVRRVIIARKTSEMIGFSTWNEHFGRAFDDSSALVHSLRFCFGKSDLEVVFESTSVC
jgi:hypothetical protein